MKKIAFSIALALFLNAGLAKPASSGLMIDAAAIAQNIGGNTQVIYDTVTQGIQQVNMLKQSLTQGINLNSLKDLISVGIFAKGKIETLKPMVKSTKGKNSELLEQERDVYAEAAKTEKGKKVEIVEENIAKDESLLASKEDEAKTAKQEMDRAAQRYERLRGTGTIEEYQALDEFHTKKSQYDKIKKDMQELDLSIVNQNSVLEKLQKEAAEAGTLADKKWVDMNKRAEIIKNEEADTGIIIQAADNNTKWENIKNMDNFTVDNATYQDFIKSYFYEQDDNAFTDLKQDSALRIARQQHQAKGDKLERQRKYLVVNTAAHLLQVSATIRRDLPIRENSAKDWFEKTKTAKDELEAIAAYSNSRIESARALTLYARLQTAKMQYLAAREINSTSLKKQGKIADNDFSKFDLEKYILTQEYIKELVDNSNKTGVIGNMQDAGI